MTIICIDGQCLKNCLQTVLNGKNVSKFDEDFIKNYDKYSNKGYILEIDVKSFIVIYYSYQKKGKLKNPISLYVICMIKKNILFTQEP